MRTWFWTLLVFVAAVALALLLRDHSGNVLILVQPWRIELSLTFTVLLLIGSFLLLHLLLRAITWVGASPGRFRSWRNIRAQKRDQNLLESGWMKILEGRYEQADKDLARLLGKTRSRASKVVAGLASARAAHQLNEYSRRDEILNRARTHAQDDVRLREAVAVVAAELYLDEQRAEEALVLLQPLQDASSRYFHAARLLLRAHRQLGNDDRVFELARILQRRGAINAAQATALIESSAAARLRQGGPDSFKTIWAELKSDERVLPAIAQVAAELHARAGNHDEAARVLEAALDNRLDPVLLAAYAQCPPDQVRRRLSKAEVWLRSNPEDPALLAALGSLCLTGELWGQAERYLLDSMRLRSDMRIHALLGNLYDGLGRPADAARHWRLAAAVVGALPQFTVGRALPAADTRDDPTLIDVENPDYGRDGLRADGSVNQPPAASAADMAGDGLDAVVSPAGRPATPPPAQDYPQAQGNDVDQYFDSAPIPGVDMSHTSDQPRNLPDTTR